MACGSKLARSRCGYRGHLALLLLSCSAHAAADDQLGAEIRYTEYGIPHVRSDDYEGIGYGQGYAQARDNLCKIELGMLAFGGELSRHFGPDAPGNSLAASAFTSQLSDFYFRGVADSGIVEALIAQNAPLGPRDEVRRLVSGYVEGFNRYFDEDQPADCAGAAWLRPMTELDVYRRVYAVTTFLDQGAMFAGGIASAEAPLASASRQLECAADQAPSASVLTASPARPGSNAIALGGDVTATGRGINLANPHLDWAMDMRWNVAQLTIPGRLDVSGAALIGVPLIVMGHTASVAWSITTTEKTRRHAIYELTLASDSPTTYLVDGVPEAMQPRPITIEVKRPDGSLEALTRTQWWTRYGPVIGEGSALPLPPWSASSEQGPGRAYALADANRSNMRMLNTLFAFNHAETSSDILRAIRENQGVPWWTVVAADADGQALLSQIQVMPHLTDEQLERCSTEFGRALFANLRAAVLDGARSDCAFQTDADAIEPGIFGPGDDRAPRLPFTLSRDYVENSNDSHWLPSAHARISGMPRMVGDEATERSLRTRGVISEIEAQKASGAYTRELLAAGMLSNRSYAADLVLDAAVALCRDAAEGELLGSSGEPVDVRGACDVLDDWDRAMDIDSPGALLFSKFWVRAFQVASGSERSLWKVPFDPADPVHTPNTLDREHPLVAQALADTVQEFATAGIPLDALLGDFQYVERNGERIPIGGGTDQLAVMNLMTSSPGSDPSNGSGYMHVVAFDGSPCPDAVLLLTYSQSSDSSSPHFSDQTELFSDKRWVDERFCEEAILASPELEVLEL